MLATLATLSLVLPAMGHPSSLAPSSCFVPITRSSVMGRPNFNNVNAGPSLSFDPSLDDGAEYTPGQAYTVTATATAGSLWIMGSNAGSWTGGTGTACSGGSQTGYYQPVSPTRVTTYTATWTAPASGAVKIGASAAPQYGNTYTREMDITAKAIGTPTAAPAPTNPAPTAEPTTPMPTSAPAPTTPAPISSAVAVNYDGNFCDTSSSATTEANTGGSWSAFSTFAAAGAPAEVKVCYLLGTDHLTIAIQTPKGQYTAFGLSSQDAGMKDIDVYALQSPPSGLRPTLAIGWTTGQTAPAPEPDPDYMKNQQYSADGGVDQMVFTRPLTASGNRIGVTDDPELYIVVASGPSDPADLIPNRYHTFKKYSAKTKLSQAASTSAKDTSSGRRLHGILMIFAWVFLCPTAIVDARAAKGVLGPVWIKLHMLFQCTAVLLTVIGYIVISTDGTVAIEDGKANPSSVTHAKVGTLVVILSIVQIALGFLRNIISNHTDSDPPGSHGPRRVVFNFMHMLVGLVLFSLSLLNVGTGIWLGCPDDPPAGTPCADGVGWIKSPIRKVFDAGMYFAIIVYVLVALVQLKVKKDLQEDTGVLVKTLLRLGCNKDDATRIYGEDIVNVIGRHALALVAAMTLACAITMTAIISDSEWQ